MDRVPRDDDRAGSSEGDPAKRRKQTGAESVWHAFCTKTKEDSEARGNNQPTPAGDREINVDEEDEIIDVENVSDEEDVDVDVENVSDEEDVFADVENVSDEEEVYVDVENVSDEVDVYVEAESTTDASNIDEETFPEEVENVGAERGADDISELAESVVVQEERESANDGNTSEETALMINRTYSVRTSKQTPTSGHTSRATDDSQPGDNATSQPAEEMRDREEHAVAILDEKQLPNSWEREETVSKHLIEERVDRKAETSQRHEADPGPSTSVAADPVVQGAVAPLPRCQKPLNVVRPFCAIEARGFTGFLVNLTEQELLNGVPPDYVIPPEEIVFDVRYV